MGGEGRKPESVFLYGNIADDRPQHIGITCVAMVTAVLLQCVLYEHLADSPQGGSSTVDLNDGGQRLCYSSRLNAARRWGGGGASPPTGITAAR